MAKVSKHAKSTIHNPKSKGALPLIIALLSKFGIPGTFFILLMYYATGDQFRTFIDKFILLKTQKSEPYIPYLVIFCLILVFAVAIYLLQIRNKILKDQVRRLESDLELLQDTVANKKSKKQQTTE